MATSGYFLQCYMRLREWVWGNRDKIWIQQVLIQKYQRDVCDTHGKVWKCPTTELVRHIKNQPACVCLSFMNPGHLSNYRAMNAPTGSSEQINNLPLHLTTESSLQSLLNFCLVLWGDVEVRDQLCGIYSLFLSLHRSQESNSGCQT